MVVFVQDYTEEFRDISKGKSKESLPAGSITLINQRPVGDELHVGSFFYFASFSLFFVDFQLTYDNELTVFFLPSTRITRLQIINPLRKTRQR